MKKILFSLLLFLTYPLFAEPDFSTLNISKLPWDGKKTSFKLAIKPGMHTLTQDGKIFTEYKAYDLSAVTVPFKISLLSYIRPAPNKRVFYPVVMLLDADKKVIHTSKPEDFKRTGFWRPHLEWTFTPDDKARYLVITRDASFDGKRYSNEGMYFLHTNTGSMIPMPKKESTYFSRDGKLKLIVEKESKK